MGFGSSYIQRSIPSPRSNRHTWRIEKAPGVQCPIYLHSSAIQGERALRTLPAILYCALTVGTLVGSAPHAFACNGNGNCENAPGHNKEYSGAPGPIAGAGLPILAIGYGVYWLIKRRRKTD